MHRRIVLADGLASGLGLASSAGRAQAYPTKPVDVVVVFGASGTTDIVAEGYTKVVTLQKPSFE